MKLLAATALSLPLVTSAQGAQPKSAITVAKEVFTEGEQKDR